jgi:multiple sugar transport system substrate-binding protein
MNSPQADRVHAEVGRPAPRARPDSWTSYEYPDCTRDLGDGEAMMVYDADSATYPKNKPGASAQAGNLAGTRVRAGPTATTRQPVDLVVGDERRVEDKLAAWLFIQWATGKEPMAKARQGGRSPTRPASRSSTDVQADPRRVPGYLRRSRR